MNDYQVASITRVEEVLKGLKLGSDHYQEVMLRMQTAMENGIKMCPTYVTKL